MSQCPPRPSTSGHEPPCPFVSRGGLKLQAALNAFAIDVTGYACADLGCNVGGFTDCLLQHQAARVYSVDTGYGTLAWKLRQDPRVAPLERCNALYLNPRQPQIPETKTARHLAGFSGCDLVVIDLGWTRQQLAIPAAMNWLKSNDPSARIISLIKPHYEADRDALARQKNAGILSEPEAQAVLDSLMPRFPGLGAQVLNVIRSPILGGGSKGHQGNIEYLALLAPAKVG